MLKHTKNVVRKSMEMNRQLLNLVIDDERWNKALPEAAELCDKIILKVFEYIERNDYSELFDSSLPLSVNLSLSNDIEVHKLNKEFRGIDKPTNVLSFANIDDEFFELEPDNAEDVELGDIIIALETLQREAETKHISLKDHFCHLFIHGLLHLLGYDHQNDEEAEEMEKYEVMILQQFAIKNPYEE